MNMFKDLMAPYITPLQPVPTDARSFNNLRSPIRGILFDVYGTLFISASGDISNAQKFAHKSSAVKLLLAKYQVSLSPAQLNDRLFQAIESDHAAGRQKGRDFPEVQIEQILMNVLQLTDKKVAQEFSVEYEMIVNPVYPMPHLMEILQILKKQNIPMGLISNAQFFTPHLFDLFCNDFPEKLGFDPDLIFYSYKHGYAKPSLYLFKQAAAELSSKDIMPANVVYVGNDMLNDIYTAHNSGFQTCLFAGDHRSLRLRKDRPECASLKPNAVIKELNQLTDMISST